MQDLCWYDIINTVIVETDFESEVIIMIELISVIIAWIIVFTIPNRFFSKSEAKKREERYKNL